MKTFHQFREELLSEGTYPTWIRVSTAALVLRIKNLANQIARESDEHKRTALLAQQNKLLGYITGIGIGVSSTDRQLLTKMKGGR